jgi:hypothetical protein
MINALTLNRRIHFMTEQRSAGCHLFGPIYLHHEFHNYPTGIGADSKPKRVVYTHIMVGNPRKHYRWAFSLYIYWRR